MQQELDQVQSRTANLIKMNRGEEEEEEKKFFGFSGRLTTSKLIKINCF
jgi:hypothetical protein